MSTTTPGLAPNGTPGDTPAGVWLGFDTGGTFTDAVALADGRIQASAKALTTHWDLAVGLENALAALLGNLPAALAREPVTLVSVSTTLATNAVVENRFSPTCTVLVGFTDRMVERAGFGRDRPEIVVRIRGGHEATGEEAEPLDEAAIDALVAEYGERVEAFAVAAQFSVRNPAHERRVRERIRAACGKPVTCSHELSSQLDAPLRALTATLNARLTPQIRHLLEALRRVLDRARIAAPLMIVRGDGTLMRAEVALEYPVETVLSGPAASVVGAGYLSRLTDFAVSDMGGTTTDVAIVRGGRPVVRSEGAVIGGWRTRVAAVDVQTCGLGGDSEVGLDRERRIVAGPRRAMPLSRLAHLHPEVLPALRVLAGEERLPPFAPQFALRNPGRDAPRQLDRLEQRVWESLDREPRPVHEIARTAQGLVALRRLVDAGLATLAAFTPSDAMHVLGRQQGWSVEAARLGAMVLATEERNAGALRERATPQAICARVFEHVVRQSARVVLESALAHDPGLEPVRGGWGPLGRLFESAIAGERLSAAVDARLGLALPLVAIGAPVGAYYPDVAQRLGTRLVIPEHAAVCNAVGAVAGVVSQRFEVLVNQPSFKLFRVHDPAGFRDHGDEAAALADAEHVARALAIAAAERAGARDPHVTVERIERRAHGATDGDFLAEAVLRATATGRPVA